MFLVAKFLSNWINPFLTSLLFLAPAIESPRFFGSHKKTNFLRWIAFCAIALAVAVPIAEYGKRFVIWPGHPTFPSGHEAWAQTVAACLMLRNRKWAMLVFPISILMCWALVAAGYHDTVDVVGAFLLSTGIVFGLRRFLLKIPAAEGSGKQVESSEIVSEDAL